MTASTFLTKLSAAAATNSKKDKLAIVATFDKFELDLIKRTLDPRTSYYIAKLPFPPSAGTKDWGSEEISLIESLAERTLTGDAALEQVRFALHDLNPESGELLRRVILKDLKCGIGATLVNTVFPFTIADFPYMRCSLPKASNIEKWDWSRGIFVQLKADGSFARIAHQDDGGILITTRQGNTYPDCESLFKLGEDARWTFPSNTEAHGELTVWIDGVLQPRTIGNGMLNSLQQGGEFPEGAEVRFDVWDLIPLASAVPKGKYLVPYADRFTKLAAHVQEAGKSSIMLIESSVVYSYAEAMGVYKAILARGLEGVILKSPSMIWADNTSKDAVKLKLEVDVDLEIIGFNPGEPGKRTELTFGSVRCQSSDGLLEVDVAGFNREMEAFLHENRDSVLGKVMCVKANAVSAPSLSNEKHSLFHPRFVELRDDKYEPDSLRAVLDQFEAAIN